jgi:HEAT repeat protein
VTHNADTVSGDGPQERRAKIIAAGYRANADDQLLLRNALIDPDPGVRSSAVLGLARAHWLTRDQLATALTDSESLVRRTSLQLLNTQWALDTSFQLTRPLLDRLHDADDLCVIAALQVVGTHCLDHFLEEVMSIARSKSDPLVVEEAIATLGELGDPRGLATILANASGKPAIRRRVVVALGAFEGIEVDAALDALSEDRDWQVRQAVAMLRKAPLDGSP